MSHLMNRVNLVGGALALGFTLSEAVQRAIGEPLAAWAGRHGFTPQAVSMCLRFYEGRVYPEIRDRLAETLGAERATVDGWIEAQRKSLAAA